MNAIRAAWALIALTLLVGAICVVRLISYPQSSFLWSVPLFLMTWSCATALVLAMAIQQRRHRLLILPGATALCVSGVFWVLGLFEIDEIESGGAVKAAEQFFFALLAIFIAWLGGLLPVLAIEARERALRWGRRLTLVALTVLALLWLVYAALDNFFSVEDQWLMSALAIATAVVFIASLCLIPLTWLERERLAGAPPGMQLSHVTCPRCAASCAVTDSASTCAGCALPLQVQSREPRCACGYLLVNLQGNTCPECGKQFAARVRYEMVEA